MMGILREVEFCVATVDTSRVPLQFLLWLVCNDCIDEQLVPTEPSKLPRQKKGV
jgi:hypothetical protein